MNTVECREVIISTLSRRGEGVKHDPVRIITEVFEKDGTKIAELDPYPNTFSKEQMVDFARFLGKQKFELKTVDERTINIWLDSVKEGNNET